MHSSAAGDPPILITPLDPAIEVVHITHLATGRTGIIANADLPPERAAERVAAIAGR